MRDTIISLLEGCLYLLIVVMTIGGFVMGGTAGGIGSIFDDGPSFSIIGALLGGALGFLWAVMGTGIAFLLLKISDNVERQAMVLERLRVQTQPAPSAQPSTMPAYTATPAARTAPGSQSPSASAGVNCPQCGSFNRGRADCWNCGAPLPRN